jgi:glycine/D-amino acid oxidase-like deaminating enzyme
MVLTKRFEGMSPHQSVDAIADAQLTPFWLERGRPDANPTIVHDTECDLCIVGGGYTGLWTAILAKERAPGSDVVLIDAHEVGGAASGRNGGFVDASLTHGYANALVRFPDEATKLEQLGLANLDAIERAVSRYGIDCDFERNGVIEVSTNRHPARYTEGLIDEYEQLRTAGQHVEWLDRDQVQHLVASPTYTSGIWRKDRAALVDPAKLAWGLKATAEALGVRIFEDAPATKLEQERSGIRVHTALADIRARRVALATNAFNPLLRRLRYYVVPVYDYCMVTEPLSGEQRRSIRWDGRQGVSDVGNQFHYYRLTADDRVLWGGYDAVYHWRGKVAAEHDSRPETWAKLSDHFFQTFPQLEGVRFSHMWGGAIDTCSRFCVFWGQAMRGRVAYAVGYTGLGVGASRFGAEVMLDLLEDRDTEATGTKFASDKPIPFPPEPLRYLGIQFTRWSLDREDRTGRRNLWLKALDSVGLGFDT